MSRVSDLVAWILSLDSTSDHGGNIRHLHAIGSFGSRELLMMSLW